MFLENFVMWWFMFLCVSQKRCFECGLSTFVLPVPTSPQIAGHVMLLFLTGSSSIFLAEAGVFREIVLILVILLDITS